MKTKYLILGAGPSGLSFAHALKKRGEKDFLVIEKEKSAGGLCRSVEVDGSPLDIGGGHFLDVRRPKVNEFLFEFMPEDEWNIFERDSRININGQMISHPLEANIWQMDIDMQLKYLISISKAGCVTDMEMPCSFVEWIRWKLGDEIADTYMLPYNQKMFGDELNQLGTYWLDKLPDVSFEDVLRSCLEHRAYAKQPGHAFFYYPQKYGYGELWRRMAGQLENQIIYNTSVTGIDFINKRITTNCGEIYEAEKIITTIPWSSINELVGIPEELLEGIRELKHTGVAISYCEEKMDTEAHWIYEPDLKKSYHRILVRHNFCTNSKGYWKETRKERFVNEKNEVSFINEYAYPLNTESKPKIMKMLISWAEEKNIYALGRWGEHEHYNSDVVVERAMALGERIAN